MKRQGQNKGRAAARSERALRTVASKLPDEQVNALAQQIRSLVSSVKEYRRALAARIDEALRSSRIKVTKLAKAMEVSDNALYEWRSGKAVPEFSNAVKLALLLDVSVGWIYGGEGAMRATGGQPAGYILPKQLSSGKSPLAFAPDLLDELGETYEHAITRVQDDSMEPTLKRGELVLVLEVPQPVGAADKIAGLWLLKDGRIRRVQWESESSLILICDNPLYRPGRITGPEISEGLSPDAETQNLRGRVIWRAGPI